MSHKHKVAVIGSGPAGLTAAIYTARAGLNPTVFAGLQPGGQLTTTTDVENFPGFKDGIMGPELMKEMTSQAERVGATVINKNVTKADFSGKPFKFWIDEEEHESDAIIISTGATAKLLGLEKEKELMGQGLSTCATCDGFFYRNKRVIVVGGGDSAMEEANYLSNICSEVILVHRRDGFRASKIMVDRVKANQKVTMKIPFAPVELLHDASGVTGLRVKHSETGQTEDIAADGVFYAIGHKPNSDLFKDYVDVDDHGYIKTTEFTATKTKGVFAAGDIADPTFKQAITAAGMGCQAAIQAQRYLEDLHG